MIKRLSLVCAALWLAACATPTPAPDGGLPTAAATLEPLAGLTATPFVPPALTPTLPPTETAAPSANAIPCPLTGTPIEPEVIANRRPLLVQIGNTATERPPYGLAQADVVFEALTSDTTTVFFATFFCSDANEIGSISTGRLLVKQLAPMLQAVYVYVGGANPMQDQLADDAYLTSTRLDQSQNAPGFTSRVDLRPAPYDIFAASGSLRQAARQRGISFPGTPVALTFAAALPSGGERAPVVSLAYTERYWVRWRWDEAQQLWTRTLTDARSPNAGGAQIDGATRRPLAVANVLILRAPHTEGTVVEADRGRPALEVELIGAGEAVLLRDGQQFTGQWSREDVTQWFTLTLADGTPLPLAPGQTFVQIASPDMALTVSER